MPGENGSDDLTLHADAAAVDQAYLPEAARVGGHEVLGDQRRNVPRRERVEVEGVLDRDAYGGVGCRVVYSRGPCSTCCCQ